MSGFGISVGCLNCDFVSCWNTPPISVGGIKRELHVFNPDNLSILQSPRVKDGSQNIEVSQFIVDMTWNFSFYCYAVTEQSAWHVYMFLLFLSVLFINLKL